MSPISISRADARRIWLHAQRLDEREPFGAGQGAVQTAIEHLGYVQIDTINVIERCRAPLLILTGSTRCSAAVLSTTGRLSRRHLIWRRRCRKGHAPPAAHCGCAPNAAAFTGREAMSVECNSGLLRGNRKRPRPVNEPVWVRSIGVAAEVSDANAWLRSLLALARPLTATQEACPPDTIGGGGVTAPKVVSCTAGRTA